MLLTNRCSSILFTVFLLFAGGNVHSQALQTNALSGDQLLTKGFTELQKPDADLSRCDSLYRLALFQSASIDQPEWFMEGMSDLLGTFMEAKRPDLVTAFVHDADNWIAGERPLEHLSFYHPYVCTTRVFLGWAALQQGDYDEAQARYEESLHHCTSAKDSSQIYGKLGMLARTGGLIEAAWDHWQKSLALAERSGSDAALSEAYERLGLFYANSPTPGKGIGYMEKALAMKEKIYARSRKTRLEKAALERIYFNLSFNYYGQAGMQMATARTPQQKNKAMTTLSKGLSLMRRSKEITEEMYPAGDWAFVEQGQLELFYLTLEGDIGKAEAASDRLDKLIQANEKANRRQKTQAYYYLALPLFQMGATESSLRYTQQGIRTLYPDFEAESFTSDPDPEKILMEQEPLLFDLLELKAMALGQWAESGAPGARSARIAQYQALSLFLSGLEHFTRSQEMDPASQAVLHQGLSGKYAMALDLAFKLHDLTGDNRYQEQAWLITEASRAFSIRRSLALSNATLDGGIPAEIAQQEMEFKDSLQTLSQEISAANPTEELNLRLQYQLTSKAYEQFLDRIKVEYPNYYQLKFSDDLATPADLQSQLLDEKTVLIEYFQTQAYLYVFFVSPDEFRAERFPVDHHFSARIDTLLACLSAPAGNFTAAELLATYAPLVRSAHELYQQLILPVTEWIPSTTQNLVIVPDSQLARIPFGVLLASGEKVPTSTPEFQQLDYLLKDYSVYYGYSATTLMKNLQRPKKKNRRYGEQFVGFAPEYGAPGLAREEAPVRFIAEGSEPVPADLPESRKEVEEISRKIKGRPFLGEEASEASFKAFAPSAKIIHLALHGVPNFEDPLLSSLRFCPSSRDPLPNEEDGWLYASEIYNLEFMAEMVVLSACQSGDGMIRRGEGVMSIAHAFSSSGARNVVMSYWKVSEVSTRKLMVNYYDRLLDRKPKHEALREAKLALLEKPEFSHPYYWSAFVNFGDPSPLTPKRNAFWGWLIAFITLGAVVGILMLISRKMSH